MAQQAHSYLGVAAHLNRFLRILGASPERKFRQQARDSMTYRLSQPQVCGLLHPSFPEDSQRPRFLRHRNVLGLSVAPKVRKNRIKDIKDQTLYKIDWQQR